LTELWSRRFTSSKVGDVRVEGVDAGEHLGQQEAVVVGEVSDERLFQPRILVRIR